MLPYFRRYLVGKFGIGGIAVYVPLAVAAAIAWHFLPTGWALVVIVALGLFLWLLDRLTTPTVSSGYGHRARAARAPTTGELVDAPERIEPNRCWQCGKKVRADAAVCGRCGATRFRPPVPTVHIPDISEEHGRAPGSFALPPQAWQYQQGWTPSHPTGNPSNPSMSSSRRLWPFADDAEEDEAPASPER